VGDLLTGPRLPYTTAGKPCSGGHLSSVTGRNNSHLCGGSRLNQNTHIEVTGCPAAIYVVKHKVKGSTATIEVHVPSAGKLSASGTGLSASNGASRASKTTSSPTGGTLTLKLTLSTGERRFLAKHPGRRLAATVALRFTPRHGGKRITGHVTVLIG